MPPDALHSRLLALADLVTPMAVRVAATLRLADHLHAGASTSAALAERTGTDPGALRRLIRHLAGVGLLRETEPGAYELTGLGEELRSDRPEPVRPWLDIEGAIGRADLAMVHLLHAVRTGAAAYPLMYGRGLWADLGADPALAASFDALLGGDGEREGRALAAAYPWETAGHVVDVGGGSGAVLAALLTAHPGLRGTLVDQPAAARAARHRFAAAGLDGRGEAVAGDFFDPLPPGAPVYLLSGVIHDWDDERARRILAGCARATGPGGTVLVVEGLLDAGPDRPAMTDMDLRMLVLAGGRERTLAELTGLGGAAGLRLRSAGPVGDYRHILAFSVADGN